MKEKNEGKKMKEKRSSKTIDIVSYALKVSVNGVNGVRCVFYSPFQVIRHNLKVCKLA